MREKSVISITTTLALDIFCAVSCVIATFLAIPALALVWLSLSIQTRMEEWE